MSFSAAGRRLVDGVDLDVFPGETLGVIGPNGAGKSTLLRLLAGLLPPGQGEVRFEGSPLARLNRRRVARRIALVAQQAETDERLTVRDAVELGRTPWLDRLGRWRDEDTAAVDRALAAVEMTALAERPWASLSGGERQRLHIARAHAQEPRLMLLDEPTNHLDIHHQLAILALIRSLPVTAVVALHDLHHALRCDRVLALHEGRVVALGTPLEVLTPTLLRALFGVEAHLVNDPDADGPLIAFRLCPN
ncbi:ABC transporter ATP-binding protein [Halomonas sp. 707D4]|uniref:ABC transporter ATP-binding protein n=1 Tax=Halomonas sp. 707D4 TaxID=1904455 RepID=UPI00209DF86F|nr:ABC transporter ATP-binding protein [Halomonas sp. 707D4]